MKLQRIVQIEESKLIQRRLSPTGPITETLLPLVRVDPLKGVSRKWIFWKQNVITGIVAYVGNAEEGWLWRREFKKPIHEQCTMYTREDSTSIGVGISYYIFDRLSGDLTKHYP